jgi:hypothetical protein
MRCFIVTDSIARTLHISIMSMPSGESFMTGGDDDYGDAFKQAKLEHDQRQQGSKEEQRLQAQVDADAAALSDMVLPQLQAAAEKLEPLGGSVDIRRYGRTGKSLRPTSVAFRITDRQGHKSRVYLIVPRGGTVTVTSGDGFGLTGEPQQAVKVSEKVGIQKRDDLTIENVKKLILGAIAEYRNDSKRNQRADVEKLDDERGLPPPHGVSDT